MTPAWITSQRRDRGQCESCGEHRASTEWAGTGELICWQCCQARQDTYHGRQGQ